MESRKRTLAKAITFRIVATLATVLIIFFFTEEMTLSFGIGIVDFVSKLFVYYVHERAWEKVGWGKSRHH
ncbi:MAG: DUF2061 domain-containing protein [Nanoarchaeota archaeon]